MKKIILMLLAVLTLSSCATTQKVIVYKFYAPDPKCTPIYYPKMAHKTSKMNIKEVLQVQAHNLAESKRMIDTLVLNIICHRNHLKNIRAKATKE